MKSYPIEDPVAGEVVLAVQPPLQPRPEAGGRARLAYFPGRSLSHADLNQEQQARSAALAALGRGLAAGVIEGLEARAWDSGDGAGLAISAGLGLAANGELIRLARERRVRLRDIRVHAPAGLLAGEAGGGGEPRLGPSLGELLDQGVIPEEVVLLLQPVRVAYFTPPADGGPCEYDPSEAAFENWQWLDGVRLVLYAWRSGVPADATARRRNLAAYRVFTRERQLPAGEWLPWWQLGLPLALIGLDGEGGLAFIDRNSVLRRGGGARGLAPLLPSAGERFLWQARLDQFNEELAQWLLAGDGPAARQIQAGERFRYLPPVGLLPAAAMALRQNGRGQVFFPPHYQVFARPLPHEQLDLAIAQSAALAPFDLQVPDRVEVLVPLPQHSFDPDVLLQAQVDPTLFAALATASEARGHWLGRREAVRRRASALHQAITGEPLLFASPDPGAVDDGETADQDFARSLLTGAECRFLSAQSPPDGWHGPGFDDSAWPVCAAGGGAGPVFKRLRFNLAQTALEPQRRYTLVLRGVSDTAQARVYLNGRRLKLKPAPRLPQQGQAGQAAWRFELGGLRGLLRPGANLLAVAGLDGSGPGAVDLLDQEDAFATQEQDGAVQAVEMALLQRDLAADHPLITAAERQRLADGGLAAFIDYLEAKLRRANDHVDFGFLRLRTDIYRIRQFVLGNEAGTKLATSPVLAEIAQGESAVATREDLQALFQRLRAQAPEAGGAATAATDGTSRSAVAAGLFVAGEVFGAGGDDERPGAETAADLAGGRAVFTVAGLETSALETFARRPVGEAAEMGAGLFAISDKSAGRAEVEGETPLIGWMPEFNNVTVAQRLQVSTAELGFQAGLALRQEAIGKLEALELNLDDKLIAAIRDRDYSPPADEADEAGFFAAAVSAMEDVTRLLRHVESRVAAYRLAIKRCRRSLARLRAELARADARLKVIGDVLAEARHDVSVTRALLGEERARVAAVNERRERLLAEVPFLVFRRPRSLDPCRGVPVRHLDPALSGQPLPSCPGDARDIPEPLAALLELVRDAPLRWFAAAATITTELGRLADWRGVLTAARRREQGPGAAHPLLQRDFSSGNALWQGIGRALAQAKERLGDIRRQQAPWDASRLAAMGWAETAQRLPEVVSLGDVIEGKHGRFQAAGRGADELARITRVAACLYREFSAVPPAIRLHWAERLGQYDRPPRLRNLYSLPRFAELDTVQRQAMQRLVDWLYGRVDGRYAEALDLIGDVVRVALLTASHAPVDRLLAARVAAPARVRPGSRIRLMADAEQVRIGMGVMLTLAGGQAQGRVVDIGAGEIVAEVMRAPAQGLVVEQGARAQIGAVLVPGATGER